MAEYYGLARTTIVAIEAGQRSVDEELLQSFADLYHVEAGLLKSPQHLEYKIVRYENIILSMVLKGIISEGLAAQWMETHIIEVRQRMIDRYGEDWRDATDNMVLQFERVVKAGDLDETLEAVGWTREQALTKPHLFIEVDCS